MGTFQIVCPNCNQALEVQDEWVNMMAECPTCHGNIIIPPRPVMVTPIPSIPHENREYSATVDPLSVTPFGNGKFVVTGDYYSLYSCVLQVFQDCQCRIRENDPFRGKIVGKCKYGINPFGITVTAIFYLNGNSMTLDFSATLTDAFDTMGVCRKKVSEFSDRFMGLSSSFFPNVAEKATTFPAAPPDYSQRAGESHAGRAKTSFYLGLAGLLVGFLGILALIFGAVALNKMASSRNGEGRGFAIAGMILGIIETIFMVMIFLSNIG